MISPSIGDRYSAEYAATLAEAELAILRTIAANLAAGIDAPTWEIDQLARLQAAREDVFAVLALTRAEFVAQITADLADAYGVGTLSAYADAGAALPVTEILTEQARASTAALANQAALGFDDAATAILRGTDDLYRRVVAEGTAAILTGRDRRRDVVGRILGELVASGVNAIQTANGRWSLDTYLAMAVRTSTARAAIAGHEGAMDTLNLDLVVVHPGPRACKICDRWARMILARSGSAGTIEARSLRTGEPVTIRVGGTLSQARSGGWGHPNCRCGIAAYMPGVTSADTIQRPPWDERAYRAQQQQRQLERQIRSWKRREAVALGEVERSEASSQVRAWQARMREHLAANPDLKRQSRREGLGPR